MENRLKRTRASSVFSIHTAGLHKSIIVTLGVLLPLLPLHSLAAAGEPTRVIKVAGEGKIKAPNDWATITLNIEARSESAEEAQLLTKTRLAKLSQYLKETLTGEEEGFHTVNIRMWSTGETQPLTAEENLINQTTAPTPTPTQHRKQRQWSCEATLECSLIAKKVDSLLGKCTEMGATGFSGPNFFISQKNLRREREKILKLAYSDALSKAQSLAKESNLKIEAPLSISENTISASPFATPMLATVRSEGSEGMDGAGDGAYSTEPGQSDVTESITVDFQVREKYGFEK